MIQVLKSLFVENGNKTGSKITKFLKDYDWKNCNYKKNTDEYYNENTWVNILIIAS